MSAGLQLEFNHAPPVFGSYLRALTGAGKPLRAERLPDITASRRGVQVSEADVARFRALFDLPPGPQVPPTFAHAVLAAPLQLQVLTHPRFPLRVLGTVHVRNLIEQRRPLQVGEQVDVRVSMADLRKVHNGLEHDMLTEVHDAAGTLIWRGVSTNLLRDPKAAAAARAQRAQQGDSGPPVAAEVLRDPAEWERAWPFALQADAGRRYAGLSGDWNPIHLTQLSAKLFGFKRAIIHGMWTYSKVLAVLEPHLLGGALAFEVSFKKPIFLPGRAVVRADRTAPVDAWTWSVQDRRGELVHAEGRVFPLEN